MRQYELTVIYPLEEDQFQPGRELVLADLAANGAEVIKAGDPADRDLAYDIKKRARGRYVLYNVNIDPAKLVAIDKAFKLNQNILKFLFVKVEE